MKLTDFIWSKDRIILTWSVQMNLFHMDLVNLAGSVLSIFCL